MRTRFVLHFSINISTNSDILFGSSHEHSQSDKKVDTPFKETLIDENTGFFTIKHSVADRKDGQISN